MSPSRIIIGISGASGAMYGIRLLEALRETDVETHLIVSASARVTIAQETTYSLKAVEKLADEVHSPANTGASIASGSCKTLGMIIAPCSMRSLGEIATATTGSLLTRAADVTLKERRRLVLMVRETPLNHAHLRNMLHATEMGAIVAPPVPAFYAHPASIDDIVNHTVGRMLDLFGLEHRMVQRWRGLRKRSTAGNA